MPCGIGRRKARGALRGGGIHGDTTERLRANKRILYLFIYLFIHSFIHSFIHLLTQNDDSRVSKPRKIHANGRKLVMANGFHAVGHEKKS
jgi:hypothetical protein